MTSGVDGTSIKGSISGLTAGSIHAFHIHTYGDVTTGCGDTAGHFNPVGLDHGAPDAEIRHAGDQGNFEADSSGIINIDIIDKEVKFGDEKFGNVLGRACVLHEGKDDYGDGSCDTSLQNGCAGGRIACGIIGYANPAK